MHDFPSDHEPSLSDESGTELEELRSLFLGPELHDRIMSLKLRPEDVSQVLPEAIVLRAKSQERLTIAAIPTVEDAIRNSVNQDQNILSEALFPVIGPATRKAAAAAVQNLAQSLNEGLEHSLSPQSFRWRLEAARTGKSFAEIVLSRTLLYQVEQVLLIHKETGLLLQQLVANTAMVQDADLVSAMLTAIQDFIRDSFTAQGGSSLDTLQFGELTVWIEEGPQALLACVIRGTAPQETRSLFQSVLEKVHLVHRQDFKAFQGDNSAFDRSQPYLQECLQSKFKPKRRSPIISLLPWLFLGLLLFGIGYLFWGNYQRRKIMGSYVKTLQQQPGLVVVDSQFQNNKVLISGLRDPLAADPLSLVGEKKLKPKNIAATWEPYLSFHPDLVEARVQQRLEPPETVTLQVDDQNTLVAEGVAAQNWIQRLQQEAIQVPGVLQIDTQQLEISERQLFRRLQQQVENQKILFDEGRSQPLPNSAAALQQLAADLQRLTQLATALEQNLIVSIEGQTDRVGTDAENLTLSLARANSIRDRLVARQVPPSILKTEALGASEGEGTSKNLSERRVSFKVTLN